MSDIEALAAAMGILAVVGQVVNVVLHLRIRTAILESEGQMKEWVRAQLREYVTRDHCELRHGLEYDQATGELL